LHSSDMDIGQICLQISNIGQNRSSIIDDACKTTVHALVTARLDYANSLLYGLPQTTLQRLQSMQSGSSAVR